MDRRSFNVLAVSACCTLANEVAGKAPIIQTENPDNLPVVQFAENENIILNNEELFQDVPDEPADADATTFIKRRRKVWVSTDTPVSVLGESECIATGELILLRITNGPNFVFESPNALTFMFEATPNTRFTKLRDAFFFAKPSP